MVIKLPKVILRRALRQYRARVVRRRFRNRLGRLQNSYKGRRCFVIGNGPSLRKTDVRKLKGEVTIGSNALFLLFDEMGFLPTFYTIMDNLVAQDRAEVLNSIRGTTKVFPYGLKRFLTPDEDTVYYNWTSLPDGPKFSEKFDQVVYSHGTVTFVNLQLAYYIGCREIYLLGFDHYYQVPNHATDDVIVSREPDVNHFHPDYFGPGYRWHQPRVEEMSEAYVAARTFAEKHGMRIYNATVGGRLEVFPRVDFDSLF